MPNIRPYNYVSGSTLYASTTYSSAHEGLAMYYSKYYAQCGWAALFYNNTGKDIIITNIYAMISANGANIRAKFSCKDVGTSIPDSSPISAVAGSVEVIVPRYGTTIGGWTSTSANVSVAKNHYFIAGIRTTQMDNGSWFNMARTNNNTAMNCYYSEFSGDFKRDTNTGWKSQTPEIYVSYKEASQPTYINGKRNETLEFWQGDSVSFTLSGYNNQRVIDSPTGFTITSSGSTYTVISDPSAADKTATININGYNSSSQLSLKSKYPRYTSFTANLVTLRPGQVTNLNETHLGSSNSNISYATSSNISFDGFNRLDIYNNSFSIYHKGNDSSITDFSDGAENTVWATIKYNNDPLSSSQLQIKSKHWTPGDINVSLNNTRLLDDGTTEIAITNQTNLSNIYDNSFNNLYIHGDSDISISEDRSSWTRLDLYTNPIAYNSTVYIKYSGASIQSDITKSLTFVLVNDHTVSTSLNINIINNINFNLIYPRNESAIVDSVAQYLINYQHAMPLYAYDINIDDDTSGYVIPSNFPIKIQLPTFTESNAVKYEISLSCKFGYLQTVPGTLDYTFADFTYDLFEKYSITLPLSDETGEKYSNEKEIRTFILNFNTPLLLKDLQDIDGPNPPTKMYRRVSDVVYGSGLYLDNTSIINNIIVEYQELDNNNNPLTSPESINIYVNNIIYAAPNKSSRLNETISYVKMDNDNNIIDNTIERILLDAQRINYLYGRLQEEPEINGSVELALRSNFFNEPLTYAGGKLLSESQYLLEVQLSGLYDIIDKLKNSPECKSEQMLKDKLISPRFKIASNFPICWDDKDPNSLALLQKYINDNISDWMYLSIRIPQIFNKTYTSTQLFMTVSSDGLINKFSQLIISDTKLIVYSSIIPTNMISSNTFDNFNGSVEGNWNVSIDNNMTYSITYSDSHNNTPPSLTLIPSNNETSAELIQILSNQYLKSHGHLNNNGTNGRIMSTKWFSCYIKNNFINPVKIRIECVDKFSSGDQHTFSDFYFEPVVDLKYFTASPIMETLKTVESFQTYYENINLEYESNNLNYNNNNLNYHLYN